MSNRRSNGRGPAVETTASFPNPAQDYYEGPISLDRHLVRRPTSTFVLRVTSDALASQGIRQGDEILVDRSLSPLPGRVLVVVVDDEHRLGIFKIRDGAAMLVTPFAVEPASRYFLQLLPSLEHIAKYAELLPFHAAQRQQSSVVVNSFQIAPELDSLAGGLLAYLAAFSLLVAAGINFARRDFIQ